MERTRDKFVLFVAVTGRSSARRRHALVAAISGLVALVCITASFSSSSIELLESQRSELAKAQDSVEKEYLR